MSVDTSTSYFSSAGDGTTTVFGYAAPLLQPSDLTVELVDTTAGVVASQVLDSDYTVSIAVDNQSASVTFAVAPPAGKNVVRRRNADYTQPYKLPANGPLPNDEIEAALDRVIMQLQAIRDTGNRGIRLADSDAPSLASLPPLAQLLNTYLFINGAGQPVGVSGVASAPIASAWTAVVTAASLALGLTAMGMSSYFQTLIGSTSKNALLTALGIVPRSFLAGLGTANNATTPNTKIDVAAGMATDSTGAQLLAYAGGTLNCATTGANALDAGTLANSTWYYLFIIGKTDGTTALLASTSLSAPTMPGGYTLKRRIGSFRTDGSAHILAYVQIGDEFLWKAPVADVASATLNTTQTLFTLSIPPGVAMKAKVRALAVASGISIAVYSPNQNTQTVGNQTVGANLVAIGGVSGASGAGSYDIFTNTSQQIAAVASSTITSNFNVMTDGWIDRRGRDD